MKGARVPSSMRLVSARCSRTGSEACNSPCSKAYSPTTSCASGQASHRISSTCPCDFANRRTRGGQQTQQGRRRGRMARCTHLLSAHLDSGVPLLVATPTSEHRGRRLAAPHRVALETHDVTVALVFRQVPQSLVHDVLNGPIRCLRTFNAEREQCVGTGIGTARRSMPRTMHSPANYRVCSLVPPRGTQSSTRNKQNTKTDLGAGRALSGSVFSLVPRVVLSTLISRP